MYRMKAAASEGTLVGFLHLVWSDWSTLTRLHRSAVTVNEQCYSVARVPAQAVATLA
jgi:hypothetical protein